MSELDNIFRNSSKAELIEYLEKDLVAADKCVVVVIEDCEEADRFTNRVLLLGVKTKYEALGILVTGEHDLMNEDNK